MQKVYGDPLQGGEDSDSSKHILSLKMKAKTWLITTLVVRTLSYPNKTKTKKIHSNAIIFVIHIYKRIIYYTITEYMY
jgi:hypothetical protein